MERLNQIMGRTVPRRLAPTNEQRQYRDTMQQGPGVPHAPAQPAARQPLPEQTARLGQKNPYTSQQQQPSQHATGGRYPAPGAERRPTNQQSQAYYETGAPPPAHTRVPQSSRVPQPQRNYSPEARRAQAFQPVEPPPAPQRLQPRQAGYYRADDYAAAPQADVIPNWNGEEEDDEDDEESGLCYGDWESDSTEAIPARRAELEIIPHPRMQPASSTRENAMGYRETSSHITRDLRDMRMPTIPPSQRAQPPQPQTRTQDVQSYRRNTQPLPAQTIAGMGRERDFTLPDTQRSARTVAPPNTPREHMQPVVQSQTAQGMPQKNSCPRCKGAGYLRANVPFGDPHFGKPIACECKEAERKEKRRQQLREMSNMDALREHSFRSFNFRGVGVQEAYQAAVDFAETPQGWLLLVGPNGCGKTHLAAAIANQSLESGAVVLFEAVPDLLDHLRAAFAPTATEIYDQLFSKMREAELLILDDLGAQQSSPWANEKLFQLLNYRYNMGMPTVITANPRGLQGIDERLRSRLGDTGLVTSINMDRARDYRQGRPRRY